MAGARLDHRCAHLPHVAAYGRVGDAVRVRHRPVSARAHPPGRQRCGNGGREQVLARDWRPSLRPARGAGEAGGDPDARPPARRHARTALHAARPDRSRSHRRHTLPAGPEAARPGQCHRLRGHSVFHAVLGGDETLAVAAGLLPGHWARACLLDGRLGRVDRHADRLTALVAPVRMGEHRDHGGERHGGRTGHPVLEPPRPIPAKPPTCLPQPGRGPARRGVARHSVEGGGGVGRPPGEGVYGRDAKTIGVSAGAAHRLHILDRG